MKRVVSDRLVVENKGFLSAFKCLQVKNVSVQSGKSHFVLNFSNDFHEKLDSDPRQDLIIQICLDKT